MYKAVWLNWIRLNLGSCIQAFNGRYKIRSRDVSFQSWSVCHCSDRTDDLMDYGCEVVLRRALWSA